MPALQVMALDAGCRLYDGLPHLAQQTVAMIPGLGLPSELADAIARATAAVAGRSPVTSATCSA